MSTTESSVEAMVDLALRAAVRAPSPHNTQPWRFEVGPRRIDLLLDRDRVLAVADPTAREARLSCGAALLNLRYALRAAGRACHYDLFPEQARPNLVATVWLGGSRPPTVEQRRLAAAIERRTTNRHPFLDREVPAGLRATLVRAAQREGGRLVMLDQPGQLGTFADLLRRADHLQEQDAAFQAELRDWTAPGAGRTDGVPRSAGGPRPATGGLLKFRDYGTHESTLERPFEQDPLIAVLASTHETPVSEVRCGEAMQRVLLTATVDGLAVSFLSQPVEVAATRTVLRELIGGQSHPQTVLRLGYGYPTTPTPRRPAAAVTTLKES